MPTGAKMMPYLRIENLKIPYFGVPPPPPHPSPDLFDESCISDICLIIAVCMLPLLIARPGI